ncbi:Major facilitator superfamily domain general substrate transporter [Penicillium cf. griseofulvum]|uniref:Major facilitator superfamily domain general substrate transporter n=1 Tax=Penicillium cf. griseofulvum TaxID=2972120 RepID=A0A9W9M1E1_9EURO|nr:Major facilitator superfamily domain general substrate transporter [Penicillium cf. griseofulvum]KAJ5429541.1 Major facilitator superfamily domain general substrate transporter [Penicillium cf. griseofulvum]KAJ5436679.1 Major facilitator superfamily domain general substrate transporter [Penicillium cf. griseofulvum]
MDNRCNQRLCIFCPPFHNISSGQTCQIKDADMQEKKPTTQRDDLPELAITHDPVKQPKNIIGYEGY